jgi:hypothetical protein
MYANCIQLPILNIIAVKDLSIERVRHLLSKVMTAENLTVKGFLYFIKEGSILILVVLNIKPITKYKKAVINFFEIIKLYLIAGPKKTLSLMLLKVLLE